MVIVSVVADNLNPPEAIIPPSFTNGITIVESGGLASSDFLIRAPYANSAPLRVSAGQQYRAQSSFAGNAPALYLETVTGTVTFTVVYE